MAEPITMKKRRFFISTTPQQSTLDEAGFAALSYTEVTGVGTLPQTGPSTNIVSFDTLDTEVTFKQRGITDAGGGDLVLARNGTDPGQVAMRAAALTNFNYAFKITDNDAPPFVAPATGSTPTTYYNRGIVTGPTHPGGGNEDFITEVFTLAMNQLEVVVEAAVTPGP